jgi:hypothetical protein
MLTALESSTLEFPAGTPDSTFDTDLKGTKGTAVRTRPRARRHRSTETAWLTATIRPAGAFGYNDTRRLRALLNALSGCASIVVLDMQAVRLHSRRASEVIQEAACDIEHRGGCLMCINVDDDSRAYLSAAGHHAVLMDHDPQQACSRPEGGEPLA